MDNRDTAAAKQNAHQSNGTLHQGWVLQLYKKTHINEKAPSGDWGHYVLGYFDWLSAQPLTSIQDLEKQTKEAHCPAAEQVVLMRHTECEGMKRDQKFPALATICFLMLQSCQETKNLFTLARTLQDSLEAEIGKREILLDATVYVTMDASALSIIYSPREHYAGAPVGMSYFTQTLEMLEYARGCDCVRDVCQYTFSMVCFLSNEEERSKLPQWQDKDQNAYRLPRGIFHFLVKPKADAYVGAFCQKYICDALTKKDSQARCDPAYMQVGTNDYKQAVYNVPFQNIAALYDREGALAEYNDDKTKPSLPWHGHLFLSVYLSIGSEPAPSKASVEDSSGLDRFMQQEAAQKPERYNPKKQDHARCSDVESFMEREYDNFMGNQGNPFLQWVFPHYRPILDGYKASFLESLELQKMLPPTPVDPIPFMNLFEEVLCAVQPNSLYATRSVGYQGIHEEFAPRALVAYTSLLNTVAHEWDKGTTDEFFAKHPDGKNQFLKPEHQFLLAVSPKPTVEAKEHNSHLPPDKSIVSICLPQALAYQPDILLPLILHEAGHFIGVRLRDNAKTKCQEDETQKPGRCREDYFILIMADQICFQLLVRARKELGKSPLEQLLHEMMFDFVQEALQDIRQDVYRIYHTCKDQYKAEWQLRGEDKVETAKEIVRRMEVSIDRGYFMLVNKVMCRAVLDFMETREAEYIKKAEDYWEKEQPTRTREGAQITKANMADLFTAMWRAVLGLLRDENGIVHVVEEAMTKLAEPVADMFMLKVLDMKWESYLLLIFEQWIKADDTTEGIKNKLLSEAPQVRYASILPLLDPLPPNDPYVEARILHIAYIWHKDVDTVRQMFAVFQDELQKRQKALNSLQHVINTSAPYRLMSVFTSGPWVCEYMQAVNDDDRYKEENLKQRIPHLEKIRAIYKNACRATHQDIITPDNGDENLSKLSFRAVFEELFDFLELPSQPDP